MSTAEAADTQRIPPGGTPGFGVVTLRTGIDLMKNVSLTVALENIGNKSYRIHGSGVNEPGRNFVIGVETRF